MSAPVAGGTRPIGFSERLRELVKDISRGHWFNSGQHSRREVYILRLKSLVFLLPAFFCSIGLVIGLVIITIYGSRQNQKIAQSESVKAALTTITTSLTTATAVPTGLSAFVLPDELPTDAPHREKRNIHGGVDSWTKDQKGAMPPYKLCQFAKPLLDRKPDSIPALQIQQNFDHAVRKWVEGNIVHMKIVKALKGRQFHPPVNDRPLVKYIETLLKMVSQLEIQHPDIVPHFLVPVLHQIAKAQGLNIVTSKVNIDELRKEGQALQHEHLPKETSTQIQQQQNDEIAKAPDQFHGSPVDTIKTVKQPFKVDPDVNLDVAVSAIVESKMTDAIPFTQTLQTEHQKSELKQKREIEKSSELSTPSNGIRTRNATTLRAANITIPHVTPITIKAKKDSSFEQSSDAVARLRRWCILPWVSLNYTTKEVQSLPILNSRGLVFQNFMLAAGMLVGTAVFVVIRWLGEDWSGFKIAELEIEDVVPTEDAHMEQEHGNRLNANVPRSEALGLPRRNA